MNRRSTSAGPIYILLLGLFIFGGCSDGPNKSVTPENNAPAILSCTADPATVPAGSTTTLTVDAVDEDGDELTYTWSADGGQFPDGNVGETVTWSPPDLMGTYTVTVTVDDGTTATDETIDLNVTVPEVVIDPAALDFGGDATSLQFSVTNAGDGVLQWSATDDSDWMSIDPAGGDVATGLGDAVTVTVDRTGLAPGSHDGTVTVTTPYGDGLVAVSLYVPATPALAVSTQALDFGAETVELQFEITNTGQGELTWTAAGSAGWLDVDPAGGATTSETDIVVVTIDRSGLDAGAHQGTVDIASNGGAESIAVDLLVSATPILAVSTQSLDFGADTVHIPFQITNTGQGELTWTVTASAAWLDVEPAAGDTREETDYILVTVDRTGLDPGAHQGTVDIASSGGGESITVDMLVSAPPALTVSTQLLDFGVEDLELSFEITNTGQGELAWTVAGSAAWLAVDPAGGATTSETDVITVTADRSGLAPDVYQDTVDIASNGGQAAVTVTLTVPAPVPPAVALSPLTLDFGTATTSLGLDVTNAGEGTLTWTATTEAAFIGLDPTDGATMTETDVLTVTVDRTGLPPGQHTGHVTVDGNGTSETATVVVSVPSGTPALTNLFFLHHSTGRNLIDEGSVRSHLASRDGDLDFWDHDYNYGCSPYYGIRNPAGTYLGYDYDIPGAPCGNTDPDGLHYLWTTANSARATILANHEVIAFKSCYPASHIYSDSELAQRKQWYLEIRDVLDQHPDKVFVIMSHPPLRRSLTNTAEADRARDFADWLGSAAFLSGHPNIVYFDFFDKLAHPDDGSTDRNMLRTEYQRSDPSDSHPNTLANQTVGPLFADALVAAAGGAR